MTILLSVLVLYLGSFRSLTLTLVILCCCSSSKDTQSNMERPYYYVSVDGWCKRYGVYFLLALAFGPQLGSGFSGNLASFWIRDGGLASFRTEKLASILIYTHTNITT